MKANGVKSGLTKMRSRAEGRATLHALAGKWVRDVETPRRFERGGPGWLPPKMRQGSAMLDTGRLKDSIQYVASTSSAVVGTKVPYAGGLNGHKGATFTINAKPGGALTIPNPKYLSPEEMRGATPQNYPGVLFSLSRGPEGPGLYTRAGGKIQKIFSYVRKVVIQARPFLTVTPELLRNISTLWFQYVAFGKGDASVPMRQGTADVGARGGVRR